MSNLIVIQVNKSMLKITLSGGRIQELVLNAVPILGTFMRIDGKQGNTHLCVPNFGNEGVSEFGLPSHGSSRNALWQLVDKTDSSLMIQYDMPQTGSYPTMLSITQTFLLTGTSLTHDVSIKNTGEKKAPVNCAIHYYWHTPEGWGGLKLNNKNVEEYVQKDTSIDLEKETIVHIPSQPAIFLTAHKNMKKVQLWTGRKEENEEAVYDQKYACIEPVMGTNGYFGSKESMLEPGGIISCWAKIQKL